MKRSLPLQSNSPWEMAPRADISLYIHVPFCKHKCPYCHFYVLTPDKNEALYNHDAFVKAAVLELEQFKEHFKNRKLRSIYFGGGTPSLLSSHHLEILLQAICTCLPIEKTVEITLEVNPETASLEKTLEWRSLGINRLSLGVQSLVNKELLALGRGHRTPTALLALENIEKAGFNNYSIDLMMETPHQNISTWKKTLDQLTAFSATHISLYNLVIEEGTVFAKRRSKLMAHLPSSQEGALMLQLAIESFEKRALARYEISAFAKEGYESVHNSGYWLGRDYLGVGPSAHSFINCKRWSNPSDLVKWKSSLERGLQVEVIFDNISEKARQAELLAIALRLIRGVDLCSFQATYGPLSKELQASIKNLLNEKLLNRLNNHLKCSEQGLLFYERVASELIILDPPRFDPRQI